MKIPVDHSDLAQLVFKHPSFKFGIGILLVVGIIAYGNFYELDFNDLRFRFSDTSETKAHMGNIYEERDEDGRSQICFYGFEVDGKGYYGSTYFYNGHHKVGELVKVEYLTDAPYISRRKAEPTTPAGYWILAVILIGVMGFGVYLMRNAVAEALKVSYILKDFKVTEAQKKGVRRVRTDEDGAATYQAQYQFTLEGTSITHYMDSPRPQNLKPTEHVLYSTRDTGKWTFFRELPHDVARKVQEEVSLVGASR